MAGLPLENVAGHPFLSERRMQSILAGYGLRATRQRIGLIKLLFGGGNRHVTADVLAAEAQAVRMPMSLATVYNVLNLFAEVGLVRGLPIEAGRMVFDTNTSNHSHFFFEDTGRIFDIPFDNVRLTEQVTPPEGYEIAKVDVVVRLRPIGSRSAAAGRRDEFATN
ncbi:MAG: iron response transcriptional regulator IrrA [Methylovirgula sp.]